MKESEAFCLHDDNTIILLVVGCKVALPVAFAQINVRIVVARVASMTGASRRVLSYAFDGKQLERATKTQQPIIIMLAIVFSFTCNLYHTPLHLHRAQVATVYTGTQDTYLALSCHCCCLLHPSHTHHNITIHHTAYTLKKDAMT